MSLIGPSFYKGGGWSPEMWVWLNLEAAQGPTTKKGHRLVQSGVFFCLSQYLNSAIILFFFQQVLFILRYF